MSATFVDCPFEKNRQSLRDSVNGSTAEVVQVCTSSRGRPNPEIGVGDARLEVIKSNMQCLRAAKAVEAIIIRVTDTSAVVESPVAQLLMFLKGCGTKQYPELFAPDGNGLKFLRIEVFW